MRLSLDTETTGIDPYHGSCPFFVTLCDEEGNQTFWEWDVDPLTRQPVIPSGDLDELDGMIETADELVLQNAKFDVTALATIKMPHGPWPWGVTHDTLMAGHLLASNQPHDLTTMALVYLGVNIKPYENDLKQAVKEARAIAKHQYPEWAVARVGDAEMPSVKGGAGACDYWLPRAIAKQSDYPSDHPWWTVLRMYSNADSAVTVELFKVMRSKLHERGLWEIYLERMKCLPVAYEMERTGVTVSRDRLDELRDVYSKESRQAGRTCLKVARDLGYDLELPKTGNNNSLLYFCFGKERDVGEGGVVRDEWLKLPVVGKTDSGKPSLDKVAMELYLDTLETGPQKTFIRSLSAKRKRDTALQYIENYERFALPRIPVGDVNPLTGAGWYVLHPSLNPTGADTLRWSSSNPNEQNISKQGMRCIECWGEGCKKCGGEGTDARNLRYAFGPAPGFEWWSLDYANIELRIPAYQSGEEKMIELFEKPDDPPFFGSYHLLNASVIYPDLFWSLAEKEGEFKHKYKSSWYQWCKNAGFALIYGCQEQKFDATAHKRGSYALLKEKLPKLFQLSLQMQEQANKRGYVETIPDRTVCSDRGYPIMCSRTKWGKVSPTIPLNYMVQSTAMWATMKAMIRAHEYFKTECPQGRIVLQVHDELVVELPYAPKKRNMPKVRRVASLMRQSGDDIGIPLDVGIEYHPNNWSEGE